MGVRKKLRFTAILLMIGYSFVRVVPVNALLRNYGVNPWAFLIIDIVTAAPYVIGLEQLAVGIKRHMSIKKLLAWVLITAASFLAPYVYIYGASRQMPKGFSLGIAVIVLLFALNGVSQIYQRVRSKE